MRKVYGMLVVVLCILTVAQAMADEFTTKAMFDPENPLIIKIASQLKGDSDLQIAENVWNWMNENIAYGESSGGIEGIITSGAGKCSQQACLAGSLLLAADFSVENVRLGFGNGHAWCEIHIEKWHRFDTCYYHDFLTEYSLPIYEQGKNYNRIDYFYYDTRETGEIILKNSSINLYNDIHIIELQIENTGEIMKVVSINIDTDLEVIGNSNNFQIQLDPGSSVDNKTYLKGEGHVRLIVDEIVFETSLFYPGQEISPEQQVQEDPEQIEPSYVEPQSVQQPVQQTVKSKDITGEIQSKGTERTIKRTVTKSESFPTWSLSFLLLIPFFLIFYKKA